MQLWLPKKQIWEKDEKRSLLVSIEHCFARVVEKWNMLTLQWINNLTWNIKRFLQKSNIMDRCVIAWPLSQHFRPLTHKFKRRRRFKLTSVFTAGWTLFKNVALIQRGMMPLQGQSLCTWVDLSLSLLLKVSKKGTVEAIVLMPVLAECGAQKMYNWVWLVDGES